jgi:hypothetical protein
VFEPGDTVILRVVFRGHVRWAFPHVVVEDTPERVVLYVWPGAEGRWIARDDAGHNLERWGSGSPPDPHVWSWNRVLKTMQPGNAYSVDLFWDDSTGEFRWWYVNLQAPFVRSSLGFDTVDHALDIVIPADGRWQWKDEDDLARCVELGLFSPAEAAEIRAEGERVIARLPELIPTGWEDWRPDPSWPVPQLPAGWHVV